MESDKQAKFLKVYANLPINLREEIVVVLTQTGPVTWNVAWSEISNNTELGEAIIKKLSEFKII